MFVFLAFIEQSKSLPGKSKKINKFKKVHLVVFLLWQAFSLLDHGSLFLCLCFAICHLERQMNQLPWSVILPNQKCAPFQSASV